MAIRIRNRVNRQRLVENILREQGDRIAEDLDRRLVRRDQKNISEGSYRRSTSTRGTR